MCKDSMNSCYVLLRDLPKISQNRFRLDNSIGAQRIAPPATWDSANGVIYLANDWALVGWCEDLPLSLMRKYQIEASVKWIGLMMFTERYGEVWEHYPWYDQEDLFEFRFKCSRQPV